MLRVCLAPLLLVGGMMGVQTSWHTHYQNPTGEIIEIQTCPSGPGLVGTLAPTSGLYGIGAQWGFTTHLGGVSMGFAPQVGISHDSYGYKELPMGTQFEVGAFSFMEYKGLVVGIKYWHLSNAGLHNTVKAPNKGLDMVAIMGGYVFE